MKKKLLAALLVIAMVVSLVACGSKQEDKEDATGEETSTEETGEETSTEESGEASAVDTSEHVVITYMVTGDKPSIAATDEMLVELNKILNEKVNAELQIYYIGWTDYLSNYNLTLAQMDGTVDLVGTASDWLDAWPNTKNGAFMKLSEDMLKTYAPKTWESVSPEHWELCKYDGDIYLMPEDNYAQWTNHGFTYRLDWAKEAGLDNGVNSWEEMTAYFKYVKEAYSDITPWDSDGTHHAQLANGWITSHSNYVAVDGIASGALWGGTKDDLFTIITPSYTETQMMVDFANTMKEWDSIGVWKTDVLNNTASSNRDDYRIGRVAAEQHHTQTWTDLVSNTNNNTIYKDDSDAASGFFYFGEETKNVVALSITHGAMALSAASKNPERALMVYDLLRNDPDVYKLFNYGIEGRQWETTAEGLRQQPASYNKDVDEIATNFWWGRNDDLEIKDARLNWEAIEALYAEYDQLKIDYPYGQFIANVDNIQAQINNVNEIHTNYMKQISFGKFQGTAEEIVAKYQAELKAAGIEEVTAELQRQFDELYK
jgi:hypothetical protein